MNVLNIYIMESFISALKDLLKYELIKQINTGDKTLDNLLNTFMLTILGWLFTFAIVKNLSFFYRTLLQKLKKKEIEPVNKDNYDYYRMKVDKTQFKYFTWSINAYPSFTRNIFTFVKNTLNFKYDKLRNTHGSFDTEGTLIIDKNSDMLNVFDELTA